MDVITLTQKLIQFNTVNPPGNENEIARYLGGLLQDNGFNVRYYPYQKDRYNVVAEIGLNKEGAAVVLSGHLDTVPLGGKEWSIDPFSGEIRDGKIYGRGSCDMKGGVAAIVTAAIKSAQTKMPKGGIRIILSASEEDGCKGIAHLTSSGVDLGRAGGIIVAEPTNNRPVCGHKGVLRLRASTSGKTAHSSMPEKGDNAIYKAARAICKIEKFNFDVEEDAILGRPTINVGVVNGGQNINSVPDKAEFFIDIRSTSKLNHRKCVEQLGKLLGKDVPIEVLVDKQPMLTKADAAFVKRVDRITATDRSGGKAPKALPYFTDAASLQAYYHGAPTIVIGPGDPAMAHQTDEFCSLESIHKAQDIFYNILTAS